MTDALKITTTRDLLEALSDDAWQKPPPGVDPALRKLAFSSGLIEATGQTSARQWHITNKGVEALERLRSGAPSEDDNAFRVLGDVINLDDPALSAQEQSEVQRLNELAEKRLEKIKALNRTIDELQQVTPQSVSPLSLVEREHYQQLLDMVNAIDPMMAEDNTGLPLVEYVSHLRQRVAEYTQGTTTGIDWYELVVMPLITFIIADNPQTTADYLRRNPAMIANYITHIMAPALRDMAALADDRARTIEERDSTIESLRRCIKELEEKLQERVIAPARAADALRKLHILEEICRLIPEADDYRAARETIDRRNAQRS